MDTYSKLKDWRKALNKKINYRSFLSDEIASLEIARESLDNMLSDEEEAAEIIQAAVKRTQDTFKVNISSIQQ